MINYLTDFKRGRRKAKLVPVKSTHVKSVAEKIWKSWKNWKNWKKTRINERVKGQCQKGLALLCIVAMMLATANTVYGEIHPADPANDRRVIGLSKNGYSILKPMTSLVTVMKEPMEESVVFNDSVFNGFAVISGSYDHIHIDQEPFHLWIHRGAKVETIKVSEEMQHVRITMYYEESIETIKGSPVIRIIEKEPEEDMKSTTSRNSERRSSPNRSSQTETPDPPQEKDEQSNPGGDDNNDNNENGNNGENDDNNDNEDNKDEKESLFYAGTGRGEDPYLIRSPEHLLNILATEEDKENAGMMAEEYEMDLLAAHYELKESIDMNGKDDEETPENIDWLPVGTLDKPFTGSFYGNGFMIENLSINRPTDDYVGLFGVIGDGGEVENLRLKNPTIEGKAMVGALAGRNDGTIKNAQINGALDTDNPDLTAGQSNVKTPYLLADQTFLSVAGGLVGINGSKGVITESSAEIVLKSESGVIGLLVGLNEGKIERSFSKGNIESKVNYTGGLVGFNYEGDIENCFAAATIKKSINQHVGGLAGSSRNGSIINSYANSQVEETGTHQMKGLVPKRTSNEPTVENSFYNKDKEVKEEGYGVAISEACFKNECTLSDCTVCIEEWDFKTIWARNEQNDGFPHLRWTNH